MSRAWDAVNRVPPPLCFGAFRPPQGLFAPLKMPVPRDPRIRMIKKMNELVQMPQGVVPMTYLFEATRRHRENTPVARGVAFTSYALWNPNAISSITFPFSRVGGA